MTLNLSDPTFALSTSRFFNVTQNRTWKTKVITFFCVPLITQLAARCVHLTCYNIFCLTQRPTPCRLPGSFSPASTLVVARAGVPKDEEKRGRFLVLLRHRTHNPTSEPRFSRTHNLTRHIYSFSLTLLNDLSGYERNQLREKWNYGFLWLAWYVVVTVKERCLIFSKHHAACECENIKTKTS